jgi:hypothetical protein
MDNGESQYFYRRRNRGKIAEIGSRRRGKSKILVQKTGVLNLIYVGGKIKPGVFLVICYINYRYKYVQKLCSFHWQCLSA